MRRFDSSTTRAVAVVLLSGAIGSLAVARSRNDDVPDPPYPHGDFDGDCSTCHSPDGWRPARIADDFDHGSYGFALDGAHRRLFCGSCHLNLEFSGTSSTCGSCHRDVHRGELGTDCGRCHSTVNFIDRADDVRSHRLTRFPLSGAHTTVDCDDCHPAQPEGALVYVNTPVECEACHLQDYQSARDPDHVAAGFGRDCAQCHLPLVWVGAGFDHAATGFPLSGAHGGLECAACHAAGQPNPSPDCYACHAEDYQSAPDHSSGGFPHDCAACHGSASWSGATVDHALFPLSGGHGGLECSQCHTAGLGTPLSADCIACHSDDFQSAPDHVAGGFPQDCTACHGTVTWSGAAVDHDVFPLSGGHGGLDCSQCHTAGIGAPLASECYACHADDYQSAPDHPGNFPTSCEDCHVIGSWEGAAVDHSAFPLTGGHGGLECRQCHTSGSLGPIPATCVTCHQADFQQAPDHVAVGFPTNCESCHGIVDWTAVNYVHAFRLRGEHDEPCLNCHTGGSPSNFSCLGSCHEHTQAESANEHREVSGYVYSFPACLSCHPDGD